MTAWTRCWAQVAERAITADLETLISEAVDSKTADYAVVTGVQIHNWSDADFNDQQPTMEFIFPSTIYAVIDGQPKWVLHHAWCILWGRLPLPFSRQSSG